MCEYWSKIQAFVSAWRHDKQKSIEHKVINEKISGEVVKVTVDLETSTQPKNRTCTNTALLHVALLNGAQCIKLYY